MSTLLSDHRGVIEEPMRGQFANPHQAFELAVKAYKLRVRLTRYADQFEVHVSDDTRHTAMCKRCREFIIGTREDFQRIECEMLDHECKGGHER